MVITEAITGQQSISDDSSPEAALINFYAAFNRQNFALMEANWLQTAEASMSNPLGGVKRGWNEIREVYKKIFGSEAKVTVEFYDYSIHASETMFLAVGRETGCLEINNQKIELAIRTTRIYCLYENQWKQVHHHGSMDNPELLANYQNTLLNKQE